MERKKIICTDCGARLKGKGKLYYDPFPERVLRQIQCLKCGALYYTFARDISFETEQRLKEKFYREFKGW